MGASRHKPSAWHRVMYDHVLVGGILPAWIALGVSYAAHFAFAATSPLGRAASSAPFFAALWVFGITHKMYLEAFPLAAKIMRRCAHRGNLLSVIAGTAYVTYLGIEVSWIGALCALFLGFCATLLIFRLEPHSIRFTLGSFIGTPLCALLMFLFASGVLHW